jgi:GTP-binding protein HflX
LGFEQLSYRVSDALSATFRDIDVETRVDNGRLMAYLAAHGEVLSQRFDDQRVIIHCRIPQRYLGRIGGGDTVVRARDATPVQQPANGAAEPAATEPAATEDVA